PQQRSYEGGGQRRFSTWAPKAIATIRSLADTLEDRAIIVQLQRKPPGAKVERLRRRDNEWCAGLRSQPPRWTADNFDKLDDPDPQMPEALNDRAADNWRPLVAIADLVGGEWPQLARHASITLSGESPEETLGVMLLADCRPAFGENAVIRSHDLVTKLAADPERSWAEYNRRLRHHLRQRESRRPAAGQGLPLGRFRGGLGALLPWSNRFARRFRHFYPSIRP